MQNFQNNESKDTTISSLQDRNSKLRQEIQKIKIALENQSSILKKPMPRQNLVTTPSEEIMQRELENANKLIKVYQTQLKNMDKTNITSVFEKIQSLEQTNGMKSNEVKELKKRLYSISKSIDGNSRKLTTFMPSNDDSDFKLSKLHEQASSMKYFVHEASTKLNHSKMNSNKQSEKIALLEKNLIQLGVSQKQLHDVKLKCSRRQNGDLRLKFTDNKEEVIEDRTIERFNQMKNELKVLGKLHLSYEKQIQILIRDVNEISTKSQKASTGISEIEQRIDFLQGEIYKMKEKLKPVEVKKLSLIKKKR